jgi:type 1 fimbria pilin
MSANVFIGAAVRRLGGAVLVLSLMVSAAQAANGRITFYGAITVPTCASAVQSVEQTMQAGAQGVTKVHCDVARTGATDPARAYALRVTSLPGDMVDARAHLYFKGFASGSGALMITQAYR